MTNPASEREPPPYKQHTIPRIMGDATEHDLNKYYKMHQQLDKAGGPDNNAALFEELILLQENILASFGLPPAQKYIKRLWKYATRPHTPESTRKVIASLQRAAEKHLLSPVTTAAEVLENARENNSSAFDVLPELGFITHDYSIFIYQELFLSGKATAQQLLTDLEKVHRHDFYAKLYHLKHTPNPDFDVDQVYEELDRELSFLNAYLQPPEETATWAGDDDDDDDTFAEKPVRPDYFYEPEATYELVKETFGVQEIVYSWDSGITLFGHFKGKPNRQVMLGCDRERLHELLEIYPPGRELLPLIELNENDEDRPEAEEPRSISFLDQYGTTLFLTEHYLELCQFDPEDDAMPANFYIISEVILKEQYEAREKAEVQLRYLSDRYQSYLELHYAGMPEKQARRQTSLSDDDLFKTAGLLFRIIETGGEIDL